MKTSIHILRALVLAMSILVVTACQEGGTTNPTSPAEDTGGEGETGNDGGEGETGGETGDGGEGETGGTDEGGEGEGPTNAPDLVSVGNFRAGPEIDGGPSTLVDYTFDETAYTQARNKFILVPVDAMDAVTANATVPEEETEGDEVLTLIFAEELTETDFARGVVNDNAVSPEQGGSEPLNVAQAADIGDGITQNPDLASVTKVEDSDDVRFEFDQDLIESDVVQNNGGLQLYFPDASVPPVGASSVEVGTTEEGTQDRKILIATYSDLPSDLTLEDAVGAIVTTGSVQATEEMRGGNDGKNLIDELTFEESEGGESEEGGTEGGEEDAG